MKKGVILLIMVCISPCTFAQNNITWTSGSNIAANTYSNMHPRISLDGAGNPLVIWGRMSDQSVYFTRWNGTSFVTPIKLNPSWLKIATASWMGPDIASHGDTVYVVVKRIPEASDTNRMFIFTSFDGGVSFNTPVELGNIADSVSRFPTVTTNATGNPIVAYMKFNSSFLDSRWVVTTSTDYGNSFSTDVKASGYSGGNVEVCDCCPGAIVSSGNVAAMLYRDNLSNVRDIWTGISTNNCSSFPSGFATDNSNWMVMSCPSSGPDGIIIGDTLLSTFMSSGTGSTRNYYSKSSISTGALHSVMSLTGTVSGLGVQNFPRIASDGNAMAIVWQQTVSGASQLPILFTNNSATGFPTIYDTVDVDNVTNTDVAMSHGKIFVVWQDDNSGTVKYRSGTYATTPASILEIDQHNFSIYPNPAKNFIDIRGMKWNEDIQKVTLSDMTGRRSYYFPEANRIDISNCSAGQYILSIQTKSKIQNVKVTKQ